MNSMVDLSSSFCQRIYRLGPISIFPWFYHEFPMMFPFSNVFPLVFLQFSHFPTVFPCFSHGFPIFPFSHSFPMFFPCFSHVFSMVFLWIFPLSHGPPSAPRRPRCRQGTDHWQRWAPRPHHGSCSRGLILEPEPGAYMDIRV